MERILVVEDDPDYMNVLRMTFGRLGNHYDVDYVSTYDEGLEAVTNGKHDLYLVDYMLDHGNTGDSLIDEAARREYPAIMLTAFDDYRLQERMRRAGAKECLCKGSVSSESIHSAVKSALSVQ